MCLLYKVKWLYEMWLFEETWLYKVLWLYKMWLFEVTWLYKAKWLYKAMLREIQYTDSYIIRTFSLQWSFNNTNSSTKL